MPRNFDELIAEDLSFVLGGETFTMVYVRPEVLASWEDEEDPETALESLARADEKIKLFLRAADHERFDALRARDENPVTSEQLNALLRWMIEVQTGRPTVPLSPSDSGLGSTEATSTDDSPSAPSRPSRRQTVRPVPRARTAG